MFERMRTQRRIGAACVATVAVFAGYVLAEQAQAQQVPVFTYSGKPHAQEPPVGPKLARLLLLPNAPSKEGQAIDSYKAGSEKPENWVFAINLTKALGCTGTLIGPQVMLTAAHCVERVRSFNISVRPHDVPPYSAPADVLIRVTCELHPWYRPTGPLSRLDFALCHLAQPFPISVRVNKDNGAEKQEVKFQRLSLSPRDVGPRQRLFLAGFGCSSRTSTNIDGRMRAGLASLSGLSPLIVALGGSGRRDSAVLCAGDSGGAAYRLASTDPYGPRVIVGVNSASSLSLGRSLIARTSSPAFRRFLDDWRRRWRIPAICGLDRAIEASCHASTAGGRQIGAAAVQPGR